MKQEQTQSGIQEQPNRNEITRARQEWIKAVILNLVIAACVSLARASIDALVNDYRGGIKHDPREYAQDGYPF